MQKAKPGGWKIQFQDLISWDRQFPGNREIAHGANRIKNYPLGTNTLLIGMQGQDWVERIISRYNWKLGKEVDESRLTDWKGLEEKRVRGGVGGWEGVSGVWVCVENINSKNIVVSNF